ncbi:MAG: AgmX/PglI C-terminal domain-containing protein [Deltaproteobacteria bacterium]
MKPQATQTDDVASPFPPSERACAAARARLPAQSANPVAAAASTIDRPAFQRAIRGHRDEFDGCYQLALRRDPTVSGQVVIRFEIAPDGHVAAASVAESAAGLDDVGECVASHAQSWTFSPPGGSGTLTTTYPFNFATAQ